MKNNIQRRNFVLSALAAMPLIKLPAFVKAALPTKGIKVDAGEDRFKEHLLFNGGCVIDFKVSSKDTDGAFLTFESSNNDKNGVDAPPLHVHHNQDETIFVLEGEFDFQVGEEKFHLKAGDSLFAPRKIPHTFICVSDKPGKMLISFQPAGAMEGFFRNLAKMGKTIDIPAIQKLFKDSEMEVVGPKLLSK